MSFRIPRRPIRRAWWRVRGLLAPRARILVYHRVGATGRDPWALSVSRQVFEEHLQLIRTKHRPMSLSDLVGTFGGRGVPSDAVVVTFDDGYLDNLEVALPLLEKYEIPASFFVAAGYIGAGREFWWDELERIVHESRAGAIRDPISSDTLLLEMYASILPLGSTEREQTMTRLGSLCGTSALPRPANAVLTREQLQRLASHRLVEIGAHTMTHPRLPAISADTQRREVVESRHTLEMITGRPITSFAYPFGECDATSRSVVREAGFACACTTQWAPVRSNQDVLTLPRLQVACWDTKRLDQVLRRVA